MPCFKRLFFLFLLSCSACQAQEDEISAPRDPDLPERCLTRVPVECEMTIMWLVDREFEQEEERRRRRKLQGKTTTIDVYFHALASEKSKDGDLRGKQITQLMGALINGFKATPFKFVYKDKTLSRNNTWHECNDEATFKKQLRVGGRDTLNVYWCDSRKRRQQITLTFSVPTPLIGLSTFPHEVENTLSGGVTADGIVMRHPHPTFLKAIPGLKGGEASSVVEVEQTFIHEVGHWLGCLHTFTGGCSPAFATSEVSVAAVGDGVSDTAAEAGPAWNNAGWKECFKTTKVPDTCPNNKKNVDKGTDPVNNYMNYVNPTCTATEGEFTKLQIERMVAQFERYRRPRDTPAPGGRQLEFLRGSGGNRKLNVEFIPDDDLIEVCVASAVDECNCELECYLKFRDLLRDFLPFHKFARSKKQILNRCNECPEVGSSEDCDEDQFCQFGNSSVLGNRCAPKRVAGVFRSQESRCWTDNQCQSGYCSSSGVCSICPELGSSEGCPEDEFCYFVNPNDFLFTTVSFHCVPKRRLGQRCFSDQSCQSGMCTGGYCSKCSVIDSKEGCPGNKKCHFTKHGWRKFFKCQRKQKLGHPCGVDADCDFLDNGAQCVDGFCRQCPTVGLTDGCGDDQFCRRNFRCREKFNTANFLIDPTPCWTNSSCLSGHCVGGVCRRCPQIGSSEGCAFDEVCVDYECERKRGESDFCFFDDECRSNDCRSGRCYGECEVDENCGLFGTCLDKFCLVFSELETRQRYFNTYDCRAGASFQRCLNCAPLADWQCEDEQYCDANGLCQTRSVGGDCERDATCVSGICIEGKCDPSPSCNSNSDCLDSQFCGGYTCQEKRQIGNFCTEHFACASDACNFQVQKCQECLDDNQCPQPDFFCSFGRCLKKECQSDEECAGDQVCKYQGEFDAWSCVECTRSSHCLDPANGACDLLSNTCVPCVDDSGCQESHFCRGNTCVEKRCVKDSDCRDDVFRNICDLKSYDCVWCKEDRDCKRFRFEDKLLCDKKTNFCEACLSDGRGCDAEKEFCSVETENNIFPNNTCVELECVENEDCPESQYCNRQFNVCQNCTRDDHCPNDDYFCFFGQCELKSCKTDLDCENATSYLLDPNGTAAPVCDTSLLWHCVPCASDFDCRNQTKNVCNADALKFESTSILVPGFCYECLSNTDCFFFQFCQGGECKLRKCTSHSDCNGTDVCTFNDDGFENVTNEFECVECIDSMQCVDRERPTCVDNVCVECGVHDDCGGNKQCDLRLGDIGGKCVVPPCLRDSDCDGEFNLCNVKTVGINECVEV